MKKNIINETTTRKIGKITYTVVASESENAKENLMQRIEKLLTKHIHLSGLKDD
jgi:hypothetical protein